MDEQLSPTNLCEHNPFYGTHSLKDCKKALGATTVPSHYHPSWLQQSSQRRKGWFCGCTHTSHQPESHSPAAAGPPLQQRPSGAKTWVSKLIERNRRRERDEAIYLVQSPELWPEKAKFTEITQICCATRCMTCVLVLRSICVIHACSVNVSKKKCQVYQTGQKKGHITTVQTHLM